MNQGLVILVLSIIGFGVLLLLGLALLIKAFYRKVLQGQALINNKMGNQTTVSFTGGLVLPIIHRSEVMDISIKTIEIDRRGGEGLICRDNIRADIKVTFFVRVNKTEEDVLKVAQSIGCVRASAQETIEELFNAKFSEALKTVGYSMDFVNLYDKREQFKDAIIQVIGTDLNGYVLEDAAIDFLEQTPLDQLDSQNILDANGIRKITELTTKQRILTNDFQNSERKQITKQDVEAQEAILALERQRETAVAAQHREIATVQAREKAETEKVQAEELLRSQTARIKSEEDIAIQNENRLRQVEVANKNRQRVVGVENERVEKDRMLEQITRERECELQTIEKNKAVEKQKKEIADIVRGRVAVEKTVAEEEERIKDVRVLADANRQKDAVIIHAEAEAQESLVKDIKKAEAAAIAASHLAKQKLIMADADLEAADREAKAQIRLADGLQAQTAAPGMAEVKVKEADAQAIEKKGMVEARVLKEKMLSEAVGTEARGLAESKAKQALAEALQREGEAEAEVTRQKMLASAEGTEKQGLAEMAVREKEAEVIEKTGQAEGVRIREKGQAEAEAIGLRMGAEAKGLREKAESMKSLDGKGKEHEEFRLALDKEKTVDLQAISVQREIAEAQARILSEAFKNARFDIVGGDGVFFDRFVNALSLGKGLDGFFHKSDAARKVLGEYLQGDRSLPTDIKDVLREPRLSTDGLQKLTLSALLTRLMTGGDDEARAKVSALIEQAKKLGIDKLTSG
ncbi:MAG: hypothetical protein ABIJ09_22530 [Pseudomonadota bacterium]